MAIIDRAVSDDSVLMASASAGDEVAFAAIVLAYHEDMRRVCLAVAGDETVADDAVAAAWAIAWRKLESVRDPVRLRPWLVSIAVNEARQLLRSKRRRAVREVGMAEAGDRGGGADPALAVSSLDVRNALNRLDPDDRALVAMRYLAGFDSNELALATGRSASGTRARLARILQRLERELGHG